MSILLKRVYDQPTKADGRRVLVDRIWPRSLKKNDARIDKWFKEIVPTTPLRKWFAHDPGKWKEFKKRYSAELDKHRETIEELAHEARKSSVTLLFASKNTELNNAVALKEYLEQFR